MNRICAALALIAVGVSGCTVPDAHICQTPVGADEAQAWLKDVATKDPGDREQVWQRYVENCTLTWAYRLASSPDNAETVSQAVLGACWGSLASLNTAASLAKTYDYRKLYPGVQPEWWLVRDGRTVSAEAAHYEEFHQKALFNVVQARAGNCKVPG